MSSQYLNLDEVAALLRVSKRTVRRRIDDGTLPAKRVGKAPNGALRVKAEDAELLLQDAR